MDGKATWAVARGLALIALALVDLSDADVGYEPLGAFTEQPVRK